jgi:hypothetical protein
MKKLEWKIDIASPVATVYDRMLGLTNKSTYEHWTAAFNPSSSYEGNWENGSKMLFVGVDEHGAMGGMISKITEHIPQRFVSIQHVGMVQAGIEITDGPEVEQWANGLEQYTFEEHNGITTVIVNMDAAEDFEGYMNDTYPQALALLKASCEQRQ